MTIVAPTGARATESPVHAYDLALLWTVTDSADTPFLFGEIEDVVIDGDEVAYVLDPRMSDIKRLDNRGEYLGSLGGRGDGPGEFTYPGRLALMPDSTLAVGSKSGGLIKIVDRRSGAEIRPLHLTGAHNDLVMLGRLRAGATPNSLIAVISEGSGEYPARRTALLSYDLADDSTWLHPVREIMEVGENGWDAHEEEEYFSLWDPWDVDATGRIVMAPYWRHYRLHFIDPDGTAVGACEFPCEHRARTTLERRRFQDYGWSGIDPSVFGITIHEAETEPVVRRIHPRNDGSLWIRTSRSAHEQPVGVLMTLDRIDADGRFAGKVALHGPGDPSLDRFYFDGDDYLVIIHGAERFIRNQRGKRPDENSHDLTVAGYRLVRRSE